MSDVTNHSGADIGAFVRSIAEGSGACRPNPAERVAAALENIALLLATLLPGDEAPAEPAPQTIMTHNGPISLR